MPVLTFSAGGKAKCDYVVNELGFDACLDHHDPALAPALAATCPNGIDVAPKAFIGLLEGRNFGKLLVRVGADP